VIPLLLAATPLAVEAAGSSLEPMQIQSFDPVARAAVMAQQLPRRWNGTYQAFGGGSPVPVVLTLTSATALGQMVDVRGEMNIAGIKLPVQGNLNANSEELDLLLLGDVPAANLEAGGRFLGLQGFSLSGWRAPRLTNPGGMLVLNPIPQGLRAPTVRGLW
jgi:hypothetical protein